ncbi:hypothetical protein HYV73_00255 [Candidatus Uhrbacteria bacterium]|nr:hypothetical protein [Candidatus Uhrbacteria bacterium]
MPLEPKPNSRVSITSLKSSHIKRIRAAIEKESGQLLDLTDTELEVYAVEILRAMDVVYL